MKQHPGIKPPLGIGLAALALAAVLSGCGGPGTTTATSSPAATSASPANASPGTAAAVDLKTASSSAGNIVVDAKGRSVYFFTKDVKDSGTSACTGACVNLWPPVLATGTPPAAEGVTGKLGTMTAPDGAKQLTLNGLPLYYFAQDKKPGDTLGQGFSNVWYLAGPAGDMIQPAAGSGY